MDQAIAFFKDLIGKENVLTDEKDLEKYHYANIPLKKREIPFVLRPGNRDDVVEIVKAASEGGIALYPISTGNNWGYGSANPVRDNSVIVDLSRMNRILDVNTELSYAVIEPGVTQEQLHRHLQTVNARQGGQKLMMDPTGSGPSCSVLGNTLERGYGITAYGDHFGALCGMEVVMADGEILHTGFGHFTGSKVTRLFRYGTGPFLDGLFTQSNYGITTNIGVWLMPEPEYYEVCYFASNRENALGELIDATRWLLLNQVVKGSINLMHRDRVLTLMMQYPFDEMNGKTPLDPGVSRRLAEELDVCDWNGVVALYGTKEEVKAAKKVIKRVLRGKVKRINFVSEQLLHLVEKLQWLAGPIGRIIGMDIKELIKVIKPSLGLMKGKPCEVSLPTPYWRSKTPVPESNVNPARDNCGVIWLAPVVPMTLKDAALFVDLVTKILNDYGFEPCITFTAVTSRAFDCTLPILYDRDDPKDTERAEQCHKKALQACLEHGYIPYRFGIQSMDYIVNEEDIFWQVAGKIKDALDPKGILSPGRYSTR